MHNEFKMNMKGELNFFFRLEIKHTKNGVFISQVKNMNDMFKKFEIEDLKLMNTPMSPSVKLDNDEHDRMVDTASIEV